ncbi:MAG: hypothetical protein RLZZ413_1134 [Pseudomonadota bacterium]
MPLRSPMTLAVPTAGRLLAPADAWAAGPGFPGTVAEIVTFRLLSGTDEARFLADARATDRTVALQPGFLRRSLSRDDTGLWTDYIEWADLASAKVAAEAVMRLPELPPLPPP